MNAEFTRMKDIRTWMLKRTAKNGKGKNRANERQGTRIEDILDSRLFVSIRGLTERSAAVRQLG